MTMRQWLAGLVPRLKLRLRRVWLHWDRYPKDGTLVRPFCGVIELRGWALAMGGTRSIEVHCDGRLLGTAAIGLRRRDVFEQFPQVRGSRHSGFQYVFDTTQVANGRHQLTFVARTRRGRAARLAAPIFVHNLATSYDRYRRQTTPNAAALAWMRRNLRHLPYRPRIALIASITANSDGSALAATVQALTAQVYDDWQLLLVGADHPNGIMGDDARIRLVEADDWPSEAAGAEWLGGLDAGDVLTPDALFEMVYHLNRHPELDFVYCDEETLERALQPGFCLGNRVFIPAAKNPVSKAKTGLPDQEKTARIGHVRKILCRRASSRSPVQPRIEFDRQPIVLTHAPCPLIDLETVRSVLIVKLDHLGDVLLTIPAMRRLRELCPEARFTALIGSWARPLLEAEPCIDEVLTYDFFAASSARNCRPLDDARAREIDTLFAGRQFDLAIDLRREADTREFLWRSGATVTAGYANRGEHDWLTVAIPWDDVNAVQPPRRHVALDALRLVKMLALAARADAITDYRLACPVDADSNRLLNERLPPNPGLLVGLHPGAGRAIKCWPAERFARLADRMITELGATVVLFGTAADAEQVQGVLHHVRRRDRLISLANELSLPQFMAVLNRLDFFVGNDSGPTHLAAAAGLPTLGVYAATIDASQWGPLGPQAAVIQRRMLCSPCYLAKKQDCPYGIACLHELSVEAVWEAAVRVLLPKWDKISILQDRKTPFLGRAAQLASE